jgi:hypothetical protein
MVFILLRPINDDGETIGSAIAVRAISMASKQPVFSVCMISRYRKVPLSSIVQ